MSRCVQDFIGKSSRDGRTAHGVPPNRAARSRVKSECAVFCAGENYFPGGDHAVSTAAEVPEQISGSVKRVACSTCTNKSSAVCRCGWVKCRRRHVVIPKEPSCRLIYGPEGPANVRDKDFAIRSR